MLHNLADIFSVLFKKTNVPEGDTVAHNEIDDLLDELRRAERSLAPIDNECSHMPIAYDPNALATLRPDQVPRMLGAITHPELNELREFSFDEVTAIQNRVSTEKVTEISKQRAGGEAGVVALFNGRLYILDGHHRVIGAWLRGDDTFNARFIDLSEQSNAMKSGTILKVDESLGLVFGWAIVCKERGEDHFDTQGDHIPEPVMLKAASEFMEGDRIAADMHVWERDGTFLSPGDDYTGAMPVRKGSVVFAFPLTTDVAKSLGIVTEKTGLLIAMKPESPEILKKFADGEYTGFSIGGSATKVAHVDPA